MSKSPTNSLLNTLKGKIWLAVSAMSLLNCVFGLLAYLAASFLVSDPFYSVFFTFFLTAASTMLFGRWLADLTLAPIEKLTLCARALERGQTSTLPRTTGSGETDELLGVLHRNSQQLYSLVTLMDDVAAGKTNTALTPLEHSDRLSASFQKLVARVVDSIDAKEQLNALQTDLARVTEEATLLINDDPGSGDLVVDHTQARRILDSIRYLATQLKEQRRTVHTNSSEALGVITEIQRRVGELAAIEERHAKTIHGAERVIGYIPDRLQRISGETAAAQDAVLGLSSAWQRERETVTATSAVVENLSESAASVSESIRRLNAGALAIPQAAKSVADLARRSSLIGINTSIQSGDGEIGMLAEEIISLSSRAENVTKELEALNETVQREISQLESIFDSMQSAIVSIKTSLLDNGAESGKIESYIGQIESLSHSASTVISELNGDQNKLTAMLIGESGSEPVSVILKSLESGFSNLGRSLEELRDASNGAGRDPMNDPAESFYRGQDPRIVQDLTEPPAYDATTIQREN